MTWIHESTSITTQSKILRLTYQPGSAKHNASRRARNEEVHGNHIIYLMLPFSKGWTALPLNLKTPSILWRRESGKRLLTRGKLTPASPLPKVVEKSETQMKKLSTPSDSWCRVVMKRQKICPIWTKSKFCPPENWASIRVPPAYFWAHGSTAPAIKKILKPRSACALFWSSMAWAHCANLSLYKISGGFTNEDGWYVGKNWQFVEERSGVQIPPLPT